MKLILISGEIPCESLGDLEQPVVAFDRNCYLVVWNKLSLQKESATGQLWCKRIDESGVILDETGFLIHRNDSMDSVLTPDIERSPHGGFWVAYTRFDNRPEYRARRTKLRHISIQ